jgi:hypothetical protein
MKRISLSAILVLLLTAGALARPAASADPSAPLDLRGYTLELGRWSELARRLREHPEEAAGLRKQLPDDWSVAVEDQHFQVSTEWLSAELDRIAANPQFAADACQKINHRLEAMLGDLEGLARIDAPDSGRARAKLDDILKRREFRSVRAPNHADTFWDQITDWLWRFIIGLISRAGGHPTATRVLLWGVVIALGMVFLGWLIYSLAHVSLANLPFRRPPAPMDVGAPAGTWQEWIQKARAAAARSQYRDAVRIIYGAAVRRIAEAGTWQVDPSRTHREYVRLLPQDSRQRPPLVAITTCFERVWYGHAQASATDYELVLAELESLR